MSRYAFVTTFNEYRSNRKIARVDERVDLKTADKVVIKGKTYQIQTREVLTHPPKVRKEDKNEDNPARVLVHEVVYIIALDGMGKDFYRVEREIKTITIGE